jgi:hypothetical protein
MADLVSVPADTLAALQSRAAQAEAAIAAREAESRAADARLMVSRGESEALVRQTQAEVNKAKESAARYASRAALTAELAGHQLGIGAAEQLGTLLGDQVVADIGADGSFNVRSKDFRSVKDFVSSTLANPDYKHFLAHGQPAAPATTPANPTATPGAPAQPIDPAQVKVDTIGEAIVMRAQMERTKAVADNRNGITDPSVGFGGFGRGASTHAALTKHISGLNWGR